MEEFLKSIQDALEGNVLFKLTLSKPRVKNDPLRNVFIRPIRLNEGIVWNETLRYQTNDKTKNYESKLLVENIQAFLEDTFYNADIFFLDQKVTLLQSKKGKFKILKSKEVHDISVDTHDHQKHRLIPESTSYLKDLGISSSNGKVYGHAQDKFKQINKFVELLANLTKDDSTIATIHDMGCGKGYLTFALHDYITNNLNPKLQTIGVEIREDLVQKCNDIALKNQFKGLIFAQGSIDDYKIEKTDVVIALHACDIATDMAIAKGLEAQAEYIVVAPCCHKQIRKAMNANETVLKPLLQFGILKERQAEMITDTIRALIMESKGYEVNVFEFISSEHTGKNVMITARKTNKKSDNALQKVQAIKKEFGIESHYLERLVTL